jgi:hypothetical protein
LYETRKLEIPLMLSRITYDKNFLSFSPPLSSESGVVRIRNLSTRSVLGSSQTAISGQLESPSESHKALLLFCSINHAATNSIINNINLTFPIGHLHPKMPAARDPNVNSGRNSPKPPPARIYGLNEPPFEGFKPVDADGFKKSDRGTAIVVDMGRSSH